MLIVIVTYVVKVLQSTVKVGIIFPARHKKEQYIRMSNTMRHNITRGYCIKFLK